MSYNLHKEKVLYVCSRMNITKLTFEDGLRLVESIRRFCVNHNIHLDDISSAVGEDVQQKIRESISKEISFKLKKPDYFALFALLIEKENESKCWEDVMNNVDQCEFDSEIKFQCCCSHPIQHVYKITNSQTKLSLLVGSECVNKYGIENLKERLKEVKRIESKKKKYRMCEDCKEYVIKLEAEHWKKCCLTCWKKEHSQKQFKKQFNSWFN